MIGVWSQFSRPFLMGLVIATTLMFALPILCVPLRWARWMGWQVPQQTALTVYFARCLGCLIVIVEWLALRAAVSGDAIGAVYQALSLLFAMMVLLHLYGAVKCIQPLSETLEIALYFCLLLLTLACFPAA